MRGKETFYDNIYDWHAITVKLNHNELGYNELGYNILGYYELGYNEQILWSQINIYYINQPGYNNPVITNKFGRSRAALYNRV
jgi:hypothetical protein